ncbi:MAG: hypothetical protein ABI821_15965 [Pseudomonadota bacterium]
MKFLAVLITASLLAACASKTSDEEKVRALIASVEEAAEAGDTSDVLKRVAPDYSDKQGLDKSQLQNFLRGYFLSHPKIELLVNIESLEFPAEGLARARIGVASVALDQFGGDTATLDVELRRHDGDWLVTRADRVAR